MFVHINSSLFLEDLSHHLRDAHYYSQDFQIKINSLKAKGYLERGLREYNR